MRTIVYVDGYNLFYGCLKHSQDKWLDIKKLFFDRVVQSQNPQALPLKLKFFTANIRAKVATNGEAARIAQHAYHRALESLYPDEICIVKGYYSLERARLLAYRNPPDKSERVDVWKLEEKQTDVNIALEAYRDAVKGDVEQLVFVSNDSDLAPVLKAIRDDFSSHLQIGVVIPIRKPGEGKARRPGNEQLSRQANWTRRYITDEELASCHLPVQIPTKKKPIRKPEYW